jgi:hypothetical protein
MNVTKVSTKGYENKRLFRRAENKPKQTQFQTHHKKTADNPKGYQPIYDKPTPQRAQGLFCLFAKPYCANCTAIPMPPPLSMFLRSTRSTLPDFIRAYWPFCFAKAVVRGKLISTSCPGLTGVIIGIEMNTPPLLTLMLLPLKNRLASGTHTLTGQANSERASLRCSTATVSIFPFSVNLVNLITMV